MDKRDVVVVGASAGGVESLRTLVAGLPADFPGTVLVVLHVPASGANALAAILDRSGPLPARPAVPGEALPAGTVLVATPDLHLLVADGHVRHSTGPRENGHRPAIDTLFRSAARALGPRVVAVVLSGTLDDGSAGLVAVRARGGVGVVQDPQDALYPAMPRHAIAAAAPEHVVGLALMPALIDRLVREDVAAVGAVAGAGEGPGGPGGGGDLTAEVEVAEFDLTRIGGDEHPGEPSGFSCPDCSGALWRIDEEGLLRFRCRVGHAWSSESLLEAQSAAMDGALWMALRSLEERAALHRELGRRAEESGRPYSAKRFGERAAETSGAAVVLRRLLADRELTGPAHTTTTGEEGR